MRITLLALLVVTLAADGPGRIVCFPGPPAVAAAAPAPLDSADFVVRGIDAGTSAERARALLGAPDSTVEFAHPHDADGRLVRWDFADLRVHFWSEDTVAGVTLTGPGVATRRGIRVGHALQAVRDAYGEPSRTSEEGWIYLDPADPSELRLIRFRTDGERVREIFVGTVLD